MKAICIFIVKNDSTEKDKSAVADLCIQQCAKVSRFLFKKKTHKETIGLCKLVLKKKSLSINS